MNYKLLIYIISIFINILTVTGQQNEVNVKYKACTGCSQDVTDDDSDDGTFTYGDETAYHSEHTISDFGPRCRSGYDFHGGIDLSSGTTDRGDLILAIEGGTVHKIVARGPYKYIIIQGKNHNYGYGHIFRSKTLFNQGDYLKSGNMVIKALDDEPDIYAIIFLGLTVTDTVRTICEKPDKKVTWNNKTYTTKNTVNQLQPIAPIGDAISGGSVPVHLHLYSFPRLPVNDINDDAFIDNPLESLSYQPKSDIGITLLHGEEKSGNTYRNFLSNDPTFPTAKLENSIYGTYRLTGL